MLKKLGFVLMGLLCVLPLWAENVESFSPSSLVGTLRFESRQVDATTFFLSLGIEMEGVVAAVVRVPGDTSDLLRITTSGSKELVEEALKPRLALARLSLDLPVLEGTMSHRLAFDASEVRKMEVVLAFEDGNVMPITLNGTGFAQGLHQSFEFRGRPCYTVSGDCSCDQNGNNCTCSPSKKCCTFPPNPCLDCVKCEITCGACTQPPPA